MEESAPMGSAVSEQTNVTEQEQALYDEFVTKAGELMYDEKIYQNLLKTMDLSKTPEDGLANIVYLIVTQLDEKSGGQIPEEMILPIAEEILAMAVELAGAANNLSYPDEVIEKALQLAVFRLLEAYGVDEGDITVALSEMGISQQQARQMVNETSSRFGGQAVFGE